MKYVTTRTEILSYKILSLSRNILYYNLKRERIIVVRDGDFQEAGLRFCNIKCIYFSESEEKKAPGEMLRYFAVPKKGCEEPKWQLMAVIFENETLSLYFADRVKKDEDGFYETHTVSFRPLEDDWSKDQYVSLYLDIAKENNSFEAAKQEEKHSRWFNRKETKSQVRYERCRMEFRRDFNTGGVELKARTVYDDEIPTLEIIKKEGNKYYLTYDRNA